MDGGSPPTIQWEDQPVEFLDSLIDFDIGYLDAQYSVELFVQQRLIDETSTAFELDGRTVYMHKYPRRDLVDLFVLWTREAHGLIRVIHVCLAD